LFTPAGKPLPQEPVVNRFWFGSLGSDEVVLAITDRDAVELHCHGGRQVVRWVIGQFLANGARQGTGHLATDAGWTPPLHLLQHAPTLRTASILLDQYHGACSSEVQRILELLATNREHARAALEHLATLGKTVGRHLIAPWRVVVAGPPNVGKSSLVNALAGYQRSIVSDVPGTTRDVVRVRTAFDGWPVELIDTAGLREADGLEAAGVELARQELDQADLVVWVMDASTEELIYPSAELEAAAHFSRETQWLRALNKIDRSIGWPPNHASALQLSAATGDGVPRLIETIVSRLVPITPEPGGAVPYAKDLADLIEFANSALDSNESENAARHLRAALLMSRGDEGVPGGG
jgi:tRNA modification GTPase